MNNNTWQLQDAKSKFSQLVEKAQTEPQFVTKHGNNSVVIISFEDYKEITRQSTDLVTFLRDSPLMGIDLEFSRNKDFPRELEL
ncbi:MAG: type II toxin-antitoxin system Phd/YefM family antitoxin [Methylococcales bacterium]|jgi:prevent-host-death family protein|nr:type II toxin-antitoxin system Phd/YefM family antitoxin [Methylococcales bacterium]MBT7408482.1 type II toxin-antitoxin system Phd/YefM family antitoxin [Methylococcales bacterium]